MLFLALMFVEPLNCAQIGRNMKRRPAGEESAFLKEV